MSSNVKHITASFLSKESVLAIHNAQLLEHGGGTGVREQNLLDSALAQPMAEFGGEFLHKDVFEMAAAYLYHIVMNHPFLDGNKRTGLASSLVFLDVSGYEIADEGTALADMVLALIEQSKGKAWAAEFLRQRAAPRH